jgi:hypothetical protein
MDREQQYLLGALIYLKNPYGGRLRPSLTEVEKAGPLKDKTRERLKREIAEKIKAKIGVQAANEDTAGGSINDEEIFSIIKETLNDRHLRKSLDAALYESSINKSTEYPLDRAIDRAMSVLNDMRLKWEFPPDPWINNVPVEDDGHGRRQLRITKALRIPYTPLDEQGNPLKDRAGNPRTYHMVIGFVGSH